MPNINPSANMMLPIPSVGNQSGPEYAININDCLTIVDGHDHTPGRGVQITAAALDINDDLSMQGNDLFLVRSVRFVSQSNPLGGLSDLGCIYEVGVDLYYNDGTGVPIRLTQNGAVAGTPGSIANLVSPASASYVSSSGTFVWQANTSTPAYMDSASIILRNFTANSKGYTLNPPPAMAADYDATLPAIPASTKIMTINSAGVMTAAYAPDNTTIAVASNLLGVVVSGIVDNVTTQAVSNQVVARNADREHNWELNGMYANLTFPLNDIDAVFIAPYNITITAIWIYSGTAGSGGTTEFDLKKATSGTASGAYTTILSTTGKITSAAASGVWTDSNSVIGAQTGVTKPVVSVATMNAGEGLRWDLLQSMTGTPADARIRIFYKQT